ncbi:MAG: hypothetical protein FWD99_01840 [Oscillospiraceae bacterium]|nr:hypothetical protein [Oscillospiraceae bacterium]
MPLFDWVLNNLWADSVVVMILAWFVLCCAITIVGYIIVSIISSIQKRINPEKYEKKKALIEERAKLDKRPEEHKSFIDSNTGEIFLRSNRFNPARIPMIPTSIDKVEEWIISGNTITIIEFGRHNKERKSVPISQLSGVTFEDVAQSGLREGVGFLKLYIAGGSGSGHANYTLPFNAHDIALAQKAHDYIAEAATKADFELATGANTRSAQEITNEIIVLQNMLYSGLITEEEFEHKKKKLLGM